MSTYYKDPFTGKETEFSKPFGFELVGIISTENNCCPGEFVFVTVNNTHNGRKNYSTQCACGGWCSTGTDNIQDAINEWDKMNKRYHRELRERKPSPDVAEFC